MSQISEIWFQAATRRTPWKKLLLKILRKTPVRSLFFNKVAGPRPVTLLKKRLWHRCSPKSLLKFLRNFFHRTFPGVWIRNVLWVSTGSALWKKLLLKMSQYLQENTFVAVSCLQPCNFIEKTLTQVFSSECRCFPVNITKFLRASIFKNIC